MTRLETLKSYLEEAKKNEADNKLYIEDLLVSIEMEEAKCSYTLPLTA